MVKEDRLIQFRGKSIENNEWVYGGYYEWADKPHIIRKDIWDKDQDTASLIEVDPETLGQFTGLRDKNKKEIFEDDIIEGPHDFGPAGYYLRRGVVKWDSLCGYNWQYWITNMLTIVGNMHDNPEALNKKFSK